MKIRIIAFIALIVGIVSLVKYGFFDSERVALCKEAMSLNADQLKPGPEGRRKFMDACRLEAQQITSEQWHCVIEALKQGAPYRQSLTKCQSTPHAS